MMSHTRVNWLKLVLLVAVMGCRASAQTDQLLPEIDVHYKLSQDVRIFFQAKETREANTPTTAELGPSIEFYLPPLVRLREITRFDLDDSKPRPLVFSIGYRYLPTPGKPPTNRLEPVITFHFPLPRIKVLLSDRNRGDLDWKNGGFTWRYRNRLQLERNLKLRSYHLSPYVSVEAFYESQYKKWSDTALYAGCVLPFGKHVSIDPYYEHQNNTGKKPNQQLDQLGLLLNLYF